MRKRAAGFRRTSNAGKPSGFRSKAASRPPPSNAGSERRHHRTRRRNAATVRPCAACQRFGSPAANIERAATFRPLAASVPIRRHHRTRRADSVRQPFRPVSNPARRGDRPRQFRRPLAGSVATVRAVANAVERLGWISSLNTKAINAYNTTFGSGTNNWGGTRTHLVNGQFLANSLALKQNKIAKSGYYYNTSGTLTAYGNSSATNGWLHAGVKGTGLVTKTATEGVVGERKIFEATDVANYHADGMSQNAQNIQDISIPTVGAVMSIVSTNAPTGTPGNVAMYDATTGALGDGVATYDGSTTYNASTDADKIAVMSGVQRKKECGGYEPAPAGQPAHDGTHPGDEDYCWLWIFPD